MATIAVFKTDSSPEFLWNDMPFFLRNYYNYMLGIVDNEDNKYYGDFRYYNKSFCLALKGFSAGGVGVSVASGSASSSGSGSATSGSGTSGSATSSTSTSGGPSYCDDIQSLKKYTHIPASCFPEFEHIRTSVLVKTSGGANEVRLEYTLNKLTLGSVIWLYYYERMGIFKILGALLDDYNYKGKYTIKIREEYSALLEHISILYRAGVASNLRDRVTLYEKSLGLTIENNYGMATTSNEAFMKTFDGILAQLLEHYAYRRLDNAISAASNATRSSVATLTTIRDSIENLKSQFQAYYFGRNTINTFLGIATVYATLCLLRLIKGEIGISNQYEKPQDFVPAAYDILVTGKPATNTDNNRFIIYDNCASYGYRLLTDLELVDTSVFDPTSNAEDPLNIWVNSIEPWVEGYKKAKASIKD